MDTTKIHCTYATNTKNHITTILVPNDVLAVVQSIVLVHKLEVDPTVHYIQCPLYRGKWRVHDTLVMKRRYLDVTFPGVLDDATMSSHIHFITCLIILLSTLAWIQRKVNHCKYTYQTDILVCFGWHLRSNHRDFTKSMKWASWRSIWNPDFHCMYCSTVL